jgi:hypothetical protein
MKKREEDPLFLKRPIHLNLAKCYIEIPRGAMNQRVLARSKTASPPAALSASMPMAWPPFANDPQKAPDALTLSAAIGSHMSVERPCRTLASALLSIVDISRGC